MPARQPSSCCRWSGERVANCQWETTGFTNCHRSMAAPGRQPVPWQSLGPSKRLAAQKVGATKHIGASEMRPSCRCLGKGKKAWSAGRGCSKRRAHGGHPCFRHMREEQGGGGLKFRLEKSFRIKKEHPIPQSFMDYQVKGLEWMGGCLCRRPSQRLSSLMGDLSRLRGSAVSGRRRASSAFQRCMDGSGSLGSRRLTCLGQAQPDGDGLVSIHDVQA
jgi:hypothetical protein